MSTEKRLKTRAIVKARKFTTSEEVLQIIEEKVRGGLQGAASISRVTEFQASFTVELVATVEERNKFMDLSEKEGILFEVRGWTPFGPQDNDSPSYTWRLFCLLKN